MADLETLSINIKADATTAYKAINNLANSLNNLSVSLAKVETGKLNDLSRGLMNLNSSIILIKGATSQADYTRIFKQLSTIGAVDTTRLNNLSASLSNLSTSFQAMSAASSFSANVKDLAAAIAKLGGVKVEQAITNLPRLEKTLANLIRTFSTLPNINQSVIDFVNSLSNLASQGQKMGSTVGTIDNALERFGTTATRATRRSHSLASAIGTLYAKFWLFMRGARALKDSFISAADYLEAFNYFDVTAKKIGKDTFAKAGVGSAEQYAEAFTRTMQEKLHKMSGLELDLESRLIKTTNAKSLGLNLTELTQYQASIASITNAMGVSQGIAESTAKAFSMLAGDMGSLKNMDFEQVAQKLQAGLAGQSRALYAFGIDITNATLEQYAYAEGITKSVSEMTQAEKAQLRLLAILDQSKVSWGDLANTINSPSNQLRMFKTNLKEVSTVFGQLFIPIMESALPIINGVALALKQLMVDIAELLGIKLNLDSFGQFGEDINDDVEAMDELNKSVKETKKSIRDFDELKVINNSNGNTNGAGEQIDLTKEIIQATAEYEKVWEEAYGRMTSKAQEIAGYISSAFEPIKEIIQDFHIGDFFKAGEDVSGLVTSIFDFVAKAIREVNWNKLGKKIGDFIKGIKWGEVLKGFGNILGSALQGALNLWKGAFSVAPFETALLSAFALLKFSGLGSVLKTGLGKALGSQLTANGLSKEFNTAIGKLGLISVAIGIGITIDNVESIKEGEYSAFSTQSLIQSMVSSLFSGAGIALAASAVGFASGGLAFGIGAAVSLAINLIAAASVDSPYASAERVWAAEHDWVEQHDLENMEIITNIKVKEGDVDVQISQIEDLADKVYDLSISYDDLTDGEKGLLKYYSDELIKVMPELADKVDSVTGAYKGSREELDKLIQKQKEQITVSAYQTNMSDVAVGISSTKLDLNKLAKERGENALKIAQIKGRLKADMGNKFTEELWEYVLQKYKDREPQSIIDAAQGIDVYKNEAILSLIRRGERQDLIDAIVQQEQIDESVNTLKTSLGKLEDEYDYYANEVKRILNETVPDNISDGDKKAVSTMDSSKLPNAVQSTMNQVDTNINNGKTVAETDMNSMFNSINDAFAGLENGKVPREVQNTMSAIENAIKTNSPKLVTLMQQLREQLQDAFANAVFDKVGNLIYNPKNVVGRMDDTIANIQKAFANGAPLLGMEKSVESELKELFGDKLPDSVSKNFTLLKDAISKGYGVNEAIVALQKSVSKESEKLGWNVVFGIAGGIWDGTKIVAGAVETIARVGINDTFTTEEKINSPSKVMEDLAEYIPEGVALGIRNGIPNLEIATSAMVNAINREFGDIKYNIPTIDYGVPNTKSGFNYNNMDSSNGFMSQIANMANQAQANGQTEVVFRIEGDPHGMFRVFREEQDKFTKAKHYRG